MYGEELLSNLEYNFTIKNSSIFNHSQMIDLPNTIPENDQIKIRDACKNLLDTFITVYLGVSPLIKKGNRSDGISGANESNSLVIPFGGINLRK